MWTRLDNRELATVLAALRYWQRKERPNAVVAPEASIAWADGTIKALQPDEIDKLCQKLNERDDASGWIAQARELYGSDEIEIDDAAALSQGDEGAFVSAWVWVSNEEMGIEAQADAAEGEDE